MKIVAPERNGWRDEALSQRHRLWGYDCPAVDIDLLMVEYDSGKACALVEYKNQNAALQVPTHPSYQALIDLADRAEIPLIACRYASDLSWFKVTPLNKFSRKLLPSPRMLKEPEWVRLLYQIRGRPMPADLFTQSHPTAPLIQDSKDKPLECEICHSTEYQIAFSNSLSKWTCMSCHFHASPP